MWVQLHGLPFGMMNRTCRHRIGKRMGEVINIDVDKDGLGWEPFLRVRVWVNITKSLLCCTLLNQEATLIWIPLKYEQLPNFYFKYGIILYTSNGCTNDGEGNKLHDIKPNQYETWLRASTTKISRKSGFPNFENKSFFRSSFFEKKRRREVNYGKNYLELKRV